MAQRRLAGDQLPEMVLGAGRPTVRMEPLGQTGRLWQRGVPSPGVVAGLESLLKHLDVENEALELLELHKSDAIRSLCHLRNARLKGLLRRVVGRIFNEIEVMGCCNDHQAGDAAGGEEGSEAAA